jgi:hypothetical protein
LSGGGYKHLAARGTDAAERIPIDGRGGAAAGTLRAIFCFVEIGLLNANIFPINVEFFCNEHRQAGFHALADLGILAHDSDRAVGSDAHEGEGLERWGRWLRRWSLSGCDQGLRGGLNIIGEKKSAPSD